VNLSILTLESKSGSEDIMEEVAGAIRAVFLLEVFSGPVLDKWPA